MLRFSIITSPAEWQELGRFRREGYAAKKPYMMNELDDKGLEEYDARGTTYAAWLGNRIVGSIRLCPFPYEVNNYIDEQTLTQFLGQGYRQEYMEWTRLLIAPNTTVPHLLHSLVIYAARMALETTPYQKYVGYCTPLTRRLFARYHLTDENIQFSIPQRGSHHYILFKGDFAEAYRHMQHQREAC